MAHCEVGQIWTSEIAKPRKGLGTGSMRKQKKKEENPLLAESGNSRERRKGDTKHETHEVRHKRGNVVKTRVLGLAISRTQESRKTDANGNEQ